MNGRTSCFMPSVRMNCSDRPFSFISTFHPPAALRYPPRPMFETVTASVDTAAQKLTHLRRFL